MKSAFLKFFKIIFLIIKFLKDIRENIWNGVKLRHYCRQSYYRTILQYHKSHPLLIIYCCFLQDDRLLRASDAYKLIAKQKQRMYFDIEPLKIEIIVKVKPKFSCKSG